MTTYRMNLNAPIRRKVFVPNLDNDARQANESADVERGDLSEACRVWRRRAACVLLMVSLVSRGIDARAEETLKNAKKGPMIHGRVMIDGPIPEVPKLKMKVGLSLSIPRNVEEERENERKTREAKEVEVPDDSLVIDKEGGIANVVIYLMKAPREWKRDDPPADPVELRSEGDHYLPHISFIRVGQTLRILGDKKKVDDIALAPLRSSGLSIVIQPDSTRDVPAPFTQPERSPTTVGSHFHIWQKAYILALDHPFAAISGSDGCFEIHDLPPGEQHFTIWHERTGFLNKNLVVRVDPDNVTKVELKYKAEQLQPAKPPQAVSARPVSGLE